MAWHHRAVAANRPMLIFLSDIHLTDALKGSAVPRAETFERFWIRIDAARLDAGRVPAHRRRH